MTKKRRERDRCDYFISKISINYEKRLYFLGIDEDLKTLLSRIYNGIQRNNIREILVENTST